MWVGRQVGWGEVVGQVAQEKVESGGDSGAARRGTVTGVASATAWVLANPRNRASWVNP